MVGVGHGCVVQQLAGPAYVGMCGAVAGVMGAWCSGGEAPAWPCSTAGGW